jgi:2-polyprenyl-3-methyl-5-hydroxy-6-metoxy-1,4-benzoquinol methylase
VLISFGMEDPAGLSTPVYSALSVLEKKGLLSLRLVEPGSVSSLKEELADYDLLVTHFGLSAFEALSAGTPVLLASPSRYHQALSAATGLAYAPYKRNRAAAARSVLRLLGEGCENWEHIASLSEGLAREYRLFDLQTESLAEYIASLEAQSPASCPLCGRSATALNRVPARFENRTYRRCARCGGIYMERDRQPALAYNRDYFFDSYKAQYGKTYLEDFQNLKLMGRERLRLIRGLLRGGGEKRLLDIGCAYGPFLAAASEAGFKPLGFEVAEDAVTYVREKLNLPCEKLAFPPKSPWRSEDFDVISLWYVIEHFPDTHKALSEVSRMLKKGGVLALATPTFRGISGLKNLGAFLEASPEDHYTVWNHRRLKALLALYGLKLKKIVMRGSHRERFPRLLRFLAPLQPRLSLGDSFEAYAVKV